MIVISVNLSAIDKKFVRKGKNGNSYLNLVIGRRKEVSEYGETHTVAISKTKEERELDDTVIYVGGGKGYFEDAVQDNALDNLTGGDMSAGKAISGTSPGDAPVPEGEDGDDDLPF